MFLPIRDTVRTPIGLPQGLVTAMVKYPQEGALELNIMHVKDTPWDARANYGVKILFGTFPLDATIPDDPLELRESRFVCHKRELFTFGKGHSGMRAVFCFRYENKKGQAGEWGPIITAVIP